MAFKTDIYQIGASATASNNFVLSTDGAGGMKIQRGNIGSTTADILSIAADNTCTIVKPPGWIVSTPTPVPTVGAFGSATAQLRTRKDGLIVYFKATVDITSIGTFPSTNGVVQLALPYPAASIGTFYEWNSIGRESRLVGYPLIGWITNSSSTLLITMSNSANTVNNNHLWNVTGFYEAAT